MQDRTLPDTIVFTFQVTKCRAYYICVLCILRITFQVEWPPQRDVERDCRLGKLDSQKRLLHICKSIVHSKASESLGYPALEEVCWYPHFGCYRGAVLSDARKAPPAVRLRTALLCCCSLCFLINYTYNHLFWRAVVESSMPFRREFFWVRLTLST